MIKLFKIKGQKREEATNAAARGLVKKQSAGELRLIKAFVILVIPNFKHIKQSEQHVFFVTVSFQLEQGTVTTLLEENGAVKGVIYKTKSNGEELLKKAYAPLTIVCDGLMCASPTSGELCALLRNLVTHLRRHKDEDVLKGQTVKNQKDPVRSEFCKSNKAVDKAFADIISSSLVTHSSFSGKI